MRSGTIKRWAARTTWLACLSVQVLPTLGDEPSRFGRLFRLGAASDPAKPAGSTAPVPANPATPPSGSMGYGPAAGTTPNSPSTTRSVAEFYGSPALSTPPSSASGSTGPSPSPRITPKPRVNKAYTEADPLVSRISIGRADGGSQFGIFLQVFADGTVIDGGGVHKVTPEVLKPVVEAVSSGDFAKVKGHCGGPAGDTFENIHVVTYERAYGKLRANAFSYSGNPQGCDHAVHHLHKVLEELQLKLDAPAGAGGSVASMTPAVVSPPPGPSAATPLGAAAPSLPPMSGGNALPMPSLPDPGLH